MRNLENGSAWKLSKIHDWYYLVSHVYSGAWVVHESHIEVVEQDSSQSIPEVGGAQQGLYHHHSILLGIHHQVPNKKKRIQEQSCNTSKKHLECDA